ncbi:MAG TPA: RnfH family protein [Steroidobacteraceae bacterium]|nr:RnfH family protein [Steroidobacteraceae bacterium]
MSGRKHCLVAFALPRRQYLWSVEVPAAAAVSEILEQARLLARVQGEEAVVPWESDSLGIFGEPCRRQDVPRDGDRVEIYRSLLNDPRASRRARVRGR